MNDNPYSPPTDLAGTSKSGSPILADGIRPWAWKLALVAIGCSLLLVTSRYLAVLFFSFVGGAQILHVIGYSIPNCIPALGLAFAFRGDVQPRSRHFIGSAGQFAGSISAVVVTSELLQYSLRFWISDLVGRLPAWRPALGWSMEIANNIPEFLLVLAFVANSWGTLRWKRVWGFTVAAFVLWRVCVSPIGHLYVAIGINSPRSLSEYVDSLIYD